MPAKKQAGGYKAPGRSELVAWVNSFLETDYTRVEELQDGIAYCQIFDAIYPGKVPLRKLNFDASNPKEFEQNLKVRASTYSAFGYLL